MTYRVYHIDDTTQRILRVFGFPLFCLTTSWERGDWWASVGSIIVSLRAPWQPLSFREREGIHRGLRIAGWRLHVSRRQ